MKWWQRGLAFLVVVVAVAIWFAHTNDVPAANILALSTARVMQGGGGSVFPTLEPQAATYPFVPTLLNIGLNILGNSNLVLTLLGVLTACLAAYFLARVTDNMWTGVTFLLAASMVRSLPECVTLSLALSSVFVAKQGRWQLAGVLMALAITAHPAAIILALLVAIWTWQTARQHIWQYAFPAVGISAIFIYAMTLASGYWLLVPLDTPTMFVLLMLATAIYLFGDKSGLRERPLNAVLLAWSILLLAITPLTMRPPTLMIVPGLLALVSLRRLTQTVGLVVLVLDGVLLPFVTTVDFLDPNAHLQTVTWLTANTAPATIIATGDLGIDAFALNRPLIDLSSTLEAPDNHRTLTDPTFFVRYAPDVVVLSGDPKQVAWGNFPTTYANTFTSGSYGVYQRVVNFTPLTSHSLNIIFNGTLLQRDDLTLTDVGITDQAHPGDLIRVRLAWKLSYNPSFEMQMRVLLVDTQGKVIANTTDKFAPDYWQSGETTTYHLLPLPADLPDGSLTLRVGIGIRDGDLGDHDILTLQVSQPQ